MYTIIITAANASSSPVAWEMSFYRHFCQKIGRDLEIIKYIQELSPKIWIWKSRNMKYIRFLQILFGQSSAQNLVERHQRTGEHSAQKTDGKEDLVASGGEAELERFPLRCQGISAPCAHYAMNRAQWSVEVGALSGLSQVRHRRQHANR